MTLKLKRQFPIQHKQQVFTSNLLSNLYSQKKLIDKQYKKIRCNSLPSETKNQNKQYEILNLKKIQKQKQKFHKKLNIQTIKIFKKYQKQQYNTIQPILSNDNQQTLIIKSIKSSRVLNKKAFKNQYNNCISVNNQNFYLNKEKQKEQKQAFVNKQKQQQIYNPLNKIVFPSQIKEKYKIRQKIQHKRLGYNLLKVKKNRIKNNLTLTKFQPEKSHHSTFYEGFQNQSQYPNKKCIIFQYQNQNFKTQRNGWKVNKFKKNQKDIKNDNNNKIDEKDISVKSIMSYQKKQPLSNIKDGLLRLKNKINRSFKNQQKYQSGILISEKQISSQRISRKQVASRNCCSDKQKKWIDSSIRWSRQKNPEDVKMCGWEPQIYNNKNKKMNIENFLNQSFDEDQQYFLSLDFNN